MITAIFGAIGDSITAFSGNLSSAFSGITDMFYDTTLATPALTPLGIVTLLTAGISIVIFAFTFIYRLIRKA